MTFLTVGKFRGTDYLSYLFIMHLCDSLLPARDDVSLADYELYFRVVELFTVREGAYVVDANASTLLRDLAKGILFRVEGPYRELCFFLQKGLRC